MKNQPMSPALSRGCLQCPCPSGAPAAGPQRVLPAGVCAHRDRGALPAVLPHARRPGRAAAHRPARAPAQVHAGDLIFKSLKAPNLTSCVAYSSLPRAAAIVTGAAWKRKSRVCSHLCTRQQDPCTAPCALVPCPCVCSVRFNPAACTGGWLPLEASSAIIAALGDIGGMHAPHLHVAACRRWAWSRRMPSLRLSQRRSRQPPSRRQPPMATQCKVCAACDTSWSSFTQDTWIQPTSLGASYLVLSSPLNTLKLERALVTPAIRH